MPVILATYRTAVNGRGLDFARYLARQPTRHVLEVARAHDVVAVHVVLHPVDARLDQRPAALAALYVCPAGGYFGCHTLPISVSPPLVGHNCSAAIRGARSSG